MTYPRRFGRQFITVVLVALVLGANDGLGPVVRRLLPTTVTASAFGVSPAPASFTGLTAADDAAPAQFGFRPAFPSANGDVGPTHYVQQVNLLVRVFT